MLAAEQARAFLSSGLESPSLREWGFYGHRELLSRHRIAAHPFMPFFYSALSEKPDINFTELLSFVRVTIRNGMLQSCTL